jgi:hypothetical protein
MNTFAKLFAISIATSLAACSVPSITFPELPDMIGGTVTGLTGTGLVLTNNGGDDLSIDSNGVFTFTTPVERGASYAVAVKSQPSNPTQMCSVSHGSGTTGDENVTDVQVNCSVSAFSVGGTVTGLAGTGLVLQDGAGETLAVTADGPFTFPTPVASGASYDVTVLTQPSHLTQECTVTGGTGIVGASNVTNVVVSCTTSKFTIGGTVIGLAGAGLVLQNNGGDDLPINADGGFLFPTFLVESGSMFAVTVLTQPSHPTQVCTVANGTGTVDALNIVNVTVTCATTAFKIGGTVTGLAGSGLVLQDNGGDDLAIGGDGPFTFPTPVASGASYLVTVAAQPSLPTQECRVSSGAGTVDAADVTNVEVTCTTSTFKIGGTVTGLAGSGLVLQDNGGDDLPVSSDGSFQFPTPVASGATFAVTVLTQPSLPTQTCTVVGGTGTVGSGDVTSVAVNCATNRYMIGGTISGLDGTVTLQNNVGDDLDVTSNGTFAFPTSVLSGSPYRVTVKTQPTAPISQTCTIVNGTGIVGGANVTDVIVTCTTNRFTIGGTVIGLAAGDSITLRDNGGDDLVRSANGGFTFATPVASGQTYAVTIVANPAAPISQSCTVANGTGTVGNGNVTNVTVTCTTNAFTISGTVAGLTGVAPVVLQDNGGDNLTVNANGGFTFATPIASGSTYAVTVLTNPLGRTCTVSNAAGTVTGSNVTNVAVTCTGVDPSSGSFFYSATNTNSATQNTFNFDIPIVAGQILTIGTCNLPGASGTGDTFLRVFDASSTQVAANDDACGSLLTFLSFTALTTGTFQVHAGCFATGSCNGTVVYTLSGT